MPRSRTIRSSCMKKIPVPVYTGWPGEPKKTDLAVELPVRADPGDPLPGRQDEQKAVRVSCPSCRRPCRRRRGADPETEMGPASEVHSGRRRRALAVLVCVPGQSRSFVGRPGLYRPHGKSTLTREGAANSIYASSRMHWSSVILRRTSSGAAGGRKGRGSHPCVRDDPAVVCCFGGVPLCRP